MIAKCWFPFNIQRHARSQIYMLKCASSAVLIREKNHKSKIHTKWPMGYVNIFLYFQN